MTDLDQLEMNRAWTLFGTNGPGQIVQQATAIAAVLKPLIKDRALYKHIGQSDHVYLEGWTLAGTMLGVFPITVSSGPIFDPDGQVTGYQATVEARTMGGSVVGRADAECTRDENDKWHRAPSFQLRSMAQTRASSKALRMPLGFIMQLAGYDSTPAEEMEAAAARGETVSGGKGVAPGWRDLQEQTRAHQRLDRFMHDHDLRLWVATWVDSKGYNAPLSKPQMAELRRAVDRELKEREDEAEYQRQEEARHESGRPASDEHAPGRPAGPTSAADGPPSAAGTQSGRGRAEQTPGEGRQDSATTPRPDNPDDGGS